MVARLAVSSSASIVACANRTALPAIVSSRSL